jgi:hypothetical protein
MGNRSINTKLKKTSTSKLANIDDIEPLSPQIGFVSIKKPGLANKP